MGLSLEIISTFVVDWNSYAACCEPGAQSGGWVGGRDADGTDTGGVVGGLVTASGDCDSETEEMNRLPFFGRFVAGAASE